jgi:uncharacterized protein YdhG (YjbR/CyaY superfamily)
MCNPIHRSYLTMATKASTRFTAEERAAMKEAAKERKSGSGEADVLAKIAEMPDSDRALAERFHQIVRETAPDLAPKTWYGMPAYAKGDKVVCHFQPAAKFKSRYATFAFSDQAQLDDGSMWPVGFALTKLTADVEKKIVSLVAQAASD